MEHRVIINADDFGMTDGINRAVVEAHRDGVLTSATLMSGMAGAQAAAEIAHETPSLGVGVHLNLREGGCVSTDDEVRRMLSPNGEFNLSMGKIFALSVLKPAMRTAIEVEFAAQIQWLIDRELKPTHIDSHKHIHCFPAIYSIVVGLAERFGISAVRWPCEPGYVCCYPWPKPLKGGRRSARILSTTALLNRRQNAKFIKTDSFLGLAHTLKIDSDFWEMAAKNMPCGTVEIMVHPAYPEGLDPARIRSIERRKVELDALCSEETKKRLADAGVKLVHYGSL
ncbi:MAG TPA: ChbG/HpnK family deacetylase [Phycisphaerales bacterium]|nr:ChbG/HpnK family deacetylase [Phycisphaerales bacterium]